MLPLIALAVLLPRPSYALHMSEVCFQGDHAAKIAPLLKRLNYRFLAKERTADAKQAHVFLAASFSNVNRVVKPPTSPKAGRTCTTRKWSS